MLKSNQTIPAVCASINNKFIELNCALIKNYTIMDQHIWKIDSFARQFWSRQVAKNRSKKHWKYLDMGCVAIPVLFTRCYSITFSLVQIDGTCTICAQYTSTIMKTFTKWLNSWISPEDEKFHFDKIAKQLRNGCS